MLRRRRWQELLPPARADQQWGGDACPGQLKAQGQKEERSELGGCRRMRRQFLELTTIPCFVIEPSAWPAWLFGESSITGSLKRGNWESWFIEWL